MSKRAAESELNDLHALVARTLRTAIEDAQMTVYNEEGEQTDLNVVSPQLLAQAIKFLKDNNITATPEAGDDLDQLKHMLKDKPLRGRAQLRAVSAKEAAKNE